jgi:hypothetical protein
MTTRMTQPRQPKAALGRHIARIRHQLELLELYTDALEGELENGPDWGDVADAFRLTEALAEALGEEV